jgi:hypothetical protein
MYGVGPGFTNLAGDPFSPIGPDIASQNDWWFRSVLTHKTASRRCGSHLFPEVPNIEL